jgi:hypothetical protein
VEVVLVATLDLRSLAAKNEKVGTVASLHSHGIAVLRQYHDYIILGNQSLVSNVRLAFFGFTIQVTYVFLYLELTAVQAIKLIQNKRSKILLGKLIRTL